jgi:hypothetical protein
MEYPKVARLRELMEDYRYRGLERDIRDDIIDAQAQAMIDLTLAKIMDASSVIKIIHGKKMEIFSEKPCISKTVCL